jgi:SAM-dependent methyltransferase
MNIFNYRMVTRRITMDDNVIKLEVQKRYAGIAQASGCCGGSSCCGDGGSAEVLVDYGELAAGVIDGADLGLGCGTPTQFAGLQAGEVVLDLGSGAGLDAFIAAQAVGPEGRVIGVDMTPEMIARAWDNAVRGGYRNVEFRLGDIEDLPVESDSIDAALSNCVINLVPDKGRVFAQLYRVLKAGGRFSISDIVTQGEVPEEVRQDVELWTGCLAGALDQEAYLQLIRDRGFRDVRIDQSRVYESPDGAGYRFLSISVQGRK